MNVLIILALILYVYAGVRQKQKITGWSGRRRTGTNNELTPRSIFLTISLVIEYLFLFAFFSELIKPLVFSIETTWLGKSTSALMAVSLIYYASPWLAWRICRPIGLSRLSRFVYWFTPFADRKELDNFAALLRASKGIPPEPPTPEKNGIGAKIRKFLFTHTRPPFVVDSWAVVMLALAWEVRGDHARADCLLRTFDLCPPGLATLGRLRRLPFEELAWHAARRKDWEAVLRRVRLGDGRRVLLLKFLAEKHLGRRVSLTRIWFAFLISPSRIRAFQFVLDVGRRDGKESSLPGTTPEMQDGLRLTHLRLLFKAAEGACVGMEEVFRLAQSWAREFTSRKQEALLRRGMELGARGVLEIAEKIEESILDELEEVLSRADGKIPEEILAETKEGGTSYTTKLVHRLRDRLYDDVYNILELFKVEQGEQVADKDLLERWEMWLGLQESASRLQQLIGTDELANLWYGTIRNVVWNSTSRMFNGSNYRTAFISMIMFMWLVEVSELLGDEDGVKHNRENVKICCDELLLNRKVMKKVLAWAA